MKRFHNAFSNLVIWGLIVLTFFISLLTLLYINTKDVLFSSLLDNKLICGIFVVTMGVLLLAVLLFYYKYIGKLRENSLDVMAWIVFILIVGLQTILLLFFVKAVPVTDAYNVTADTIEMARKGILHIDNTSGYYASYSNNNGVIVMLYSYYRVMLSLGIEDLWSATIALNVAFIDGAILLSYFFARKAFSRKSATVFMFIMLLSPATYSFLTFTYTNTFSLFFTALLLFMTLWIKQKKGILGCTYMVLVGLVAVAGYMIRPTVIITIIAIFIILFRVINKKKLCLAFLTCFLLSFCIGVKLIGSFNSQFLSDREGTKTFPITHWMMMGLSKSGGFNYEDYYFTGSYPTKTQKMEANIEEIMNRVRQGGPIGLLQKVKVKLTRVWADGINESYNTNMCNEKQSKIYDYLYGNKSGLWSVYCQAFRFITMLAILIFTVRHRKKMVNDLEFLLLLILFGALLFFLMWEANNKYCISFTLIMALLFERGLSESSQIIQKIRHYKTFRMSTSIGLLILILINGVLFMTLHNTFVHNKIVFNEYSHKDYYNRRLTYYSSTIKTGAIVTQEFTWKRKVATIGIRCKAVKDGDSNATYQISVLDENDNRILHKMITKKNIGKNGLVWINNKGKVLEPNRPYRLEFRGVEGSSDSVGIGVVDSKQIEYLENGSLYVNQEKQEQDLFIEAYNTKTGTYTSHLRYYVVFVVMLLLLTGIFMCLVTY